MADLYDHLDEKSKSEKKDLFADSTFLRFVAKFIRFEVSVDR